MRSGPDMHPGHHKRGARSQWPAIGSDPTVLASPDQAKTAAKFIGKFKTPHMAPLQQKHRKQAVALECINLLAIHSAVDAPARAAFQTTELLFMSRCFARPQTRVCKQLSQSCYSPFAIPLQIRLLTIWKEATVISILW